LYCNKYLLLFLFYILSVVTVHI